MSNSFACPTTKECLNGGGGGGGGPHVYAGVCLKSCVFVMTIDWLGSISNSETEKRETRDRQVLSLLTEVELYV